MSEKIINWLLEENNPSVRFLTLTSLLGMPMDDASVINARNNIMECGVVPGILDLQNEDGSWGMPSRFYNDKYTGASWTLLILAEMNADKDDERIRKACEFILGHSYEPESGGFSYIQSEKTKTGLPSGVIPCLTGNMTYSLIKLGFLNDPRLRKAIEWICKYQRADDAAENPPIGKVYERYTMCWGRHSCHMGVAKTFKALAAVPESFRNDDINKKINELSEYFLKHHIYKKSHNIDEISKPGWLKPGFPLMYQTDVLELLDIFASLNIKDSRLEDAIGIIEKKQSKDGFLIMENSNNGKMCIDIEKKGQPSKWLTLKALRVLKKYR